MDGNFSDWNSFLTVVTPPTGFAVGAKLTVTMKPREGKPLTVKATVTKCDPNSELRWIGFIGSAFIFSGQRYFELEPEGEGKTLLTHGEAFDGCLIPLMKPILRKNHPMFAVVNSGLKQAAEERNNAAAGR
ncbi:hypothetical protein HXX76_007648 [Chlamydomonas incerta]|uniref:SRPBCC domain-containing protein n=1 Tax=Chlamydomonas incerta TaxID=51695 RepID=A0A835SZW2_CHLIN|nr:hypothetical protein HXX76_007648 [Chlamydomonas incerta]|eukprot:KAG2434761.1 hypothetical protein HXX76_007648 [Chlamydomonas incerta]